MTLGHWSVNLGLREQIVAHQDTTELYIGFAAIVAFAISLVVWPSFASQIPVFFEVAFDFIK
jgi:hypothetical protein